MARPDLAAVDRLFDYLVDLPQQERRSALDAERLDAATRNTIEELLRHFDAMAESGGALPALGNLESDSPSTPLPERIDQFAVRRVLGSGGMGIVYLAEQEDPTRDVAIKVLRADLLTEGTERRFQLESQALGRLSHPGIATIYEVGVADLGRGPQRYFAMEYIEGRSITDYVRSAALDDRTILELAARVCEAIHHAHQKGVVHRDLKPANILVDESGAPKILDFGIARVADVEAEDPQLLTRTGHLIGTLAYISPEQVSGQTRAIDSRTDVYALGVIVYELLTGTLPLDVVGKPLSEVVKTVLETDPLPLTKLRSDLASDVEWIVAKAMEKDPQRRYASAQALALDIRRWLADEPISARPPTTLYRVAKFARRNRGWVMAGASALGALAAITVISIVQAVRVSAAYDERGLALEDANATVSFLSDMLGEANPYKSAGNPSVRELLDLFAGRIARHFAERPRVAARLSHTIGIAYSGLGLTAEAEPLLRQAHDIWVAELGEDHPLALEALSDLAVEFVNQQRWDEAAASLDDVVRVGSESLGPEAAVVVSARIRRMTRIQTHAGGPEAVERECRELLDSALRVLGPDDHHTIRVQVVLGQACYNDRRYDEAAELFEEILATRERIYGPHNPSVADASVHLVRTYINLDRADEAVALSERALRIYESSSLGPDHPNALVSQGAHAEALAAQGRGAEAAEAAAAALQRHVDALGEAHPNTWQMMITAADLIGNAGYIEEAVEVGRRAVRTSRLAFPEDHLGRAYADCTYGAWLLAAERYDQAIAKGQEALDYFDRHGGADILIEEARRVVRDARAARGE